VGGFGERSVGLDKQACNLRHARRSLIYGVVIVSFCEAPVRKRDVVIDDRR
jgi:hypothetical protein